MTRDIAASVRGRLTNLARETNRPLQDFANLDSFTTKKDRRSEVQKSSRST